MSVTTINSFFPYWKEKDGKGAKKLEQLHQLVPKEKKFNRSFSFRVFFANTTYDETANSVVS